MNDNIPVISVIMPVYNGENFLKEAIESILNQTYEDFEFIISYDESSDKSFNIIKSYQEKDSRIILSNGKNRGLVKSLNDAIKISKGKYIARMDADDISLPKRFEEQINFMSKEELDICGTFIELFNKDATLGVIKYPETDQNIKFTLMFMTSFAHPSVIIKKSVFKKVQYKNYEYAEDYRLWTDIALGQYRMGNISKALLKYRVHNSQISKRNSLDQMHKTKSIAEKFRKNISYSHIVLFNKDLSLYYENSTITNLNALLDNFKMVAKIDGISPEFSLGAVRYVFKNSSKMNVILFIFYYIKIRKMGGGIWQEIPLFIASLFGVHKNSFIFKKIKNSGLL